MHVYLIASQEKLVERIEELRKLIDIIHSQGHILARDWVEPTYAKLAGKGINDTDWHSVFRESMEAITRSDVVIAEADTPSLGIGYQIAVAIQLKKPILILRNEKLHDDFFLAGIESNFAAYRKYNKENVEEIVIDFLAENTIENKDLRFNFFIDRQIYNYLRWASTKRGKTKAEILRELVLREIKKEDEI